MIFGRLIIVTVAVLLSTVAGKDDGSYELSISTENGSMGLDTDSLCRSAGFVPMNHKKTSPTKNNDEVDGMLLAGAGGQPMSASTIILVVLSVVVVIISTVFLGNYLYNKAKAHEYSL